LAEKANSRCVTSKKKKKSNKNPALLSNLDKTIKLEKQKVNYEQSPKWKDSLSTEKKKYCI